MTEATAEITFTAPVVVPEAGRLYRYDNHRNPSGRLMVFVTEAAQTVTENPSPQGAYPYGTWAVRGYAVTTAGVLTDEPVTLGGEIGRPYGTRQVAWCRRLGGDAGDTFAPVFSAGSADLFGASSTAASVEHQGRARHMA